MGSGLMERLNAVPVLQALAPWCIEEVGIHRIFPAGRFIFRQGDPTTGLWAVLQGRVAVERIDAAGRLVIIGVWQHELIPTSIPGLWDGGSYVGSCRTLDDHTETLWIPRERVLDWLSAVPEFADRLCCYLADRFLLIQKFDGDTRGRPLPAQLAVLLNTLAGRLGSDIPLTHEDLAHMVGAQRETVTRTLAQFAHQGWIDIRYGHIWVLDGPRLARAAGEIEATSI